MIDCHCHLVDNKFKDDVDNVIEQAKEMGVKKFVVVPEFRNQFEKVMKLREDYPENVLASIGIHPVQKKKRCSAMADLIDMERFITENRKNIHCIGEIGLDFTTSQFKSGEVHEKLQGEVFFEQLRLARIFDLPVNVHSRSAAAETLVALSHTSLSGVLLHAFGGNENDIMNGVQRGFYFSVPPSYTDTEYGEMLVRKVPLDLLLLESDSPALGPKKGERNTPSNCILSAQFISKIKEQNVEDIINITTQNARNFIKLRD